MATSRRRSICGSLKNCLCFSGCFLWIGQPEMKFNEAQTALFVLLVNVSDELTFAPYRGAGDLLSLLRQRK